MENKMNRILRQGILPVLAPELRRIINHIDDNKIDDLIEIRLRVGKPLILERQRGELIVDSRGNRIKEINQAYSVTAKVIKDTLNLMTKSSLFTLEGEIKAGFFTLTGGHRVGLVGQVIADEKGIKRIKHISGLNIRICQEIIGAGDKVIKEIVKGRRDIYNTLIISPPRCGKTTLIRDLTRQLSDGIPNLRFNGLKVGVVDERSEIGGAYQGVAQNRLGVRTDLLDRCPKAEGMMLLIRSMSPDVIVTDEIGSEQDVKALQEAINAGVRIITTVHGSSLDELKLRPSLKKIINSNTFQRIIILSHRQGAGTVEKIIKI
ncbi:stage III sporulation protein AA [Orenia metallireducens]|jgi:stage III sporulation protein AA|uniref:Stage III sporulation protein AA n=1 Tax=Orenia metallireducens TaxID=1413210 RepID=A0A1C0A9H5_9FIRM|nr:stage III sporulation protein AA [Orenia metallireducens]OCL26947.1 stage III sporulation protein AA [Orenia metallireducens]